MMKKNLQSTAILLILILLFMSGCDSIIGAQFNNLLDENIELEFKDFFRENISPTSIGSNNVESAVMINGNYITSHYNSGSYISYSPDLSNWNHLEDLIAPHRYSGKFISDGDFVIGETEDAFIIINSDLSISFNSYRSDIDGLWRGMDFHDGNLYLLRSSSLYVSDNYGQSMSVIFEDEDELYDDLQDLTVSDDGIFINMANDMILYRSLSDTEWSTTTDLGFGSFDTNSIFSENEGLDDEIFICTNQGIVRSNDGLLTTTVYDSSTPGISEDNLISVFKINNTIVAIGDHSIFISLDDGSSWTQRYPSGTDPFPNLNDVYIASDGTILLSSPTGLWSSTDDGANWTQSSHHSGFPHSGFNDLLIDGTDIYAATNWGVARSTDGGTTWTTAGIPEGLTWPKTSLVFKYGSNLYAMSEDGTPYESTDNGTSWANWVAGRYLKDVQIDGTMIYGCDGSGIHIYNGSSWADYTSADGLFSDEFYNILWDGTRIYACNGNDSQIAVSDDDGANWQTLVTNEVPNSLGIIDTTVFYGTDNGELWRSTDGFQTEETPITDGADGVQGFLNIDNVLFFQTDKSDYEGLAILTDPMGQVKYLTGAIRNAHIDTDIDAILSCFENTFYYSTYSQFKFAEIYRPSQTP